MYSQSIFSYKIKLIFSVCQWNIIGWAHWTEFISKKAHLQIISLNRWHAEMNIIATSFSVKLLIVKNDLVQNRVIYFQTHLYFNPINMNWICRKLSEKTFMLTSDSVQTTIFASNTSWENNRPLIPFTE